VQQGSDSLSIGDSSEYDPEEDIGPPLFQTPGDRGLLVTRTDFTVQNQLNQRVECSWWKPRDPTKAKMPCVVFLHGNSSCRIDCLDLLTPALERDFTIVAIDFSGSGCSEVRSIAALAH
jgi:pimeloyl-ACP methyl ester carboxylesterase